MKRLIVLLLSGCATTSGVMEAEGGTYLISAQADPASGGATGAMRLAHEGAQTYCATKGARAVVVGTNERDVYQSSFAAGRGWAGGGTSASGNVNLRFRCE